MSSTSKQIIIIDGKKYEVTGTIDFKVVPIDGPPVPDPDPTTKPTEGTVLHGGWGGNPDANTWKIVNMKKPKNQFKIVDDKGVNIATNFTTKAIAQQYIDWAKANPDPNVPPVPPVDPPVDPDKPPVDPPVDPPVEGGGMDKFGVKTIYATTGKAFYDYVLKPNAGLRHNFDALKVPTPNGELTGYFSIDKAPDDEVSGKWSVTTHSDGNHVKCLDMGVDNTTGKARYRYEDPHPDYTGTLATGSKNGLPLEAKYHGWKFIRLTMPDGSVQLEVWQDQGDNEGDKPANQWVQLAKWTVANEHAVKDYPDGIYAVLRLDGDGIEENLKQKWLSYVEVKPPTS